MLKESPLDDSGIWSISYILDEDNQDNCPLIDPVVVPEVPDDKKPATSDLTLITIAVVIVLAIVVVGVALYRRKDKQPVKTNLTTAIFDSFSWMFSSKLTFPSQKRATALP